MTLAHLLLLNFGLAAYLTGLIWTVQLVHYPGFAHVEPAQFERFHREHSARISWVVMAPMLLELGAAGWLAWQGEALGAAARWGQLALVLLVWASTFFITVPFHNRLARRLRLRGHRRPGAHQLAPHPGLDRPRRVAGFFLMWRI